MITEVTVVVVENPMQWDWTVAGLTLLFIFGTAAALCWLGRDK